MPTSTRKQRELREREERFLDAGRALLLEGGYHGLTMDRVAERTEYSKGTVYHHFASKEDLIVALLLRLGARRLELFERAAAFAGRSRERMHAVGVAAELLPRMMPDHDLCERLLKAESIRAKAAPERVDRLHALDQRVLGVCFGLARDAVAQGDLPAPAEGPLEDLTLGLWSLFQGAFAIMATDIPLEDHGFGDPFAGLQRNAALLLDGWGWRPLSSDLDLRGLRARILRDVFPEEARSLGIVSQ